MIPTLKVVPLTGNQLRQLYLKLMIPTLKVVPVTGILLRQLYLKLMGKGVWIDYLLLVLLLV
jgi:hypothetical protein